MDRCGIAISAAPYSKHSDVLLHQGLELAMLQREEALLVFLPLRQYT
jgi:hypothetical protein